RTFILPELKNIFFWGGGFDHTITSSTSPSYIFNMSRHSLTLCSHSSQYSISLLSHGRI
ncbi:hypothetical protein ACHAXM_000432, partial [Skeletonema potamos]